MDHLDDRSLGAVLKTALDAVVVMSTDGLVVGWNEVAERTFGWTFAQARGRRMGDLIVPPRHREAHERGLAHFLATGEGPVLDRHFEITAMHSNGAEIPVELSITHTRQFGEPVFLGFLRDISERRDAQRRQQLMIGELNHRVKNLLGVVAGVAHQTAKSSAAIPDFIEAFGGRLTSLGRAHEILTAATWERASLRVLLDELLAPHRDGGDSRIMLAGPEVLLDPHELIGCSMILHELITNAVKYGALSHSGGRLAVHWGIENASLALHWSEAGGTNVVRPLHRGFGANMIERSARHDLKGSAVFGWTAEGLQFALRFALSQEGAS